MLIDYKKVNIYQQEGNKIHSDVDFHAEEGEFIYIIGKVGTGKSTFLKTLYLELDIDEAENAIVFDEDICNLKRKHIPSLRKQMGVIFQDFQLLTDRTVKKNMEFVLRATGWKSKEDIYKRTEEVLCEVGMLDKAEKMPHELSGGEQQRVAIARAILNNPKLIIADEPTGNLDPDTAASIIELLRHITQTGAAVIMTTHNVQMIEKYPGIVYRCIDGHLEDVTKNYNRPEPSDEEPTNN